MMSIDVGPVYRQNLYLFCFYLLLHLIVQYSCIAMPLFLYRTYRPHKISNNYVVLMPFRQINVRIDRGC